jgi:hypothetical protein
VCGACCSYPRAISTHPYTQDSLHPLSDEAGATNPFHTWLVAVSGQLDDYERSSSIAGGDGHFRDENLADAFDFLRLPPAHRRAIRAAVETLGEALAAAPTADKGPCPSGTRAPAQAPSAQGLPPLTAPHFCPQRLSNFTEWRGALAGLEAAGRSQHTTGAAFSIPKGPTFFCDKVPFFSCFFCDKAPSSASRHMEAPSACIACSLCSCRAWP